MYIYNFGAGQKKWCSTCNTATEATASLAPLIMTDFGYITDPSLNCLSFTQAFRCSTRHRLLIFHNSKDTGYFISKFFMQFLVHLLLDSTLLTKELIYETKWTSHLCSSRFDVSKYLTTGTGIFIK